MTIYRVYTPFHEIIESESAKSALSALASRLRADGMASNEVWGFIVRNKGRIWDVDSEWLCDKK